MRRVVMVGVLVKCNKWGWELGPKQQGCTQRAWRHLDCKMQALKHCVSVAPQIRKPIAVERISRTTILRSNEGVWTGWLVRDGAGSFQMFLEFVGWMPGRR